MKLNDFFIKSYKRLEAELMVLSECVHFCDAHTEIYSHRIVELTLNCGAEIEAIAKELYCRENLDNSKSREQLKFDFDCCKWFIDSWELNLKEIKIASGSFSFSDHIRTLYPLSGAELPRNEANCAPWKIAYMAAKHNRINEFSECTLFRLLEAMAALYLLNIVFAEDIVLIEEGIQHPNELQSEIFEPAIYIEHGRIRRDKTACIYELVDYDDRIGQGQNELIITTVRVLNLLNIETVNKRMEKERFRSSFVK